MYVPEKCLEAEELMVAAVASFFEKMAEAEKTNPAEAKDMMRDLKEIDPFWAEKVQEYGADAAAKVMRFMNSQSDRNLG